MAAEFVPYFSYNTSKINAAGLALFNKSPKLYTLVILLRAGSILHGELFSRADALPQAVKDSIPGWFADWIAFVERWDDYISLSGELIESGLEDPLGDVVPGSIAHEFIVKPLLLGKLPGPSSEAARKWTEATGRDFPLPQWDEFPAWKRFGPGADFGAMFSLVNQLNALGLTEDGWVSEGWYERLGQLLHTGFSAGAETLGEGFGVLAEEWEAASKAAGDTFSDMADQMGKEIKKAVGGAGGMVVLAVVGLGVLILATRGRR